jgi:hypothetical protein
MNIVQSFGPDCGSQKTHSTAWVRTFEKLGNILDSDCGSRKQKIENRRISGTLVTTLTQVVAPRIQTGHGRIFGFYATALAKVVAPTILYNLGKGGFLEH